MKTADVTVRNPSGLHARPASVFAREAAKYKSNITLIFNGTRYNAKSVLKLLLAEVGLHDTITLEADGADEDAALDALVAIIMSGLGEEIIEGA